MRLRLVNYAVRGAEEQAVGVLAEEFVVPLRRLLEACPTVTLPAGGINQALDVLTY